VSRTLAVSASGSKLFFDDDQETPDTADRVFEFERCHLIFEQRIWTPYREHGLENGVVLYGDGAPWSSAPRLEVTLEGR
jgi:hypothetical protein